jgi:hypothetical protein
MKKNMIPARIIKAPSAAPIPIPAFAPVDSDDVDVDVGVDVGEVDKAVEAGDADTEVDEVDEAVVVLGVDVSDACHLISIPYALRFARPVAVDIDSDAVKRNVLVTDP